MKICFYSPYIPEHFGGGEKHLFDVATSAARFHEVYIGVPHHKIKSAMGLEDIQNKYFKIFNHDFKNITFVTTPLGTLESSLTKLMWTRQFDGLYYVTDGSLFFSLSKNNFLHIQVPLQLPKSNIIDRLKLGNWRHKNTNSYFTKQVIESSWHTKINEVIHPMVDLGEFNAQAKKEKIILNVGRFFKQLHSKRQDVLIDMFKRITISQPNLFKDWQLVLVGAVEDQEYVAELKSRIGSLPIKLMHEVERKELTHLYESAAIYWHATGYEADETVSPEKMEHFGISTVEAMASGALPIVHYKGGQKEILGDDLRQLGWLNIEDGIKKTVEVASNAKLASSLKTLAARRAEAFSKPQFDRKIELLFSL